MSSTPDPPTTCESCGKEGLVYAFQGHHYCPVCLSKKRPPLAYRGPERRRGNRNVLGFTRRSTDRKDPGQKP